MCKNVTRITRDKSRHDNLFLKEREDNLIFALLATAAPEVRVGEAERVVETDDRVELDREGLKVGLGLLDLDRGAGRRRSDERRGDREAGESDGELLRGAWRFSVPRDVSRFWYLCGAERRAVAIVVCHACSPWRCAPQRWHAAAAEWPDSFRRQETRLNCARTK